jgi:NTE family protein
VLAALQDAAGWDARDAAVAVGTSAGSIVAALLRAGLEPRDYAAFAVGDPVSPEAARIFARSRGEPVRPAPTEPLRWRPAAPGLLLRAVRRPWEARLGTLAAAALPGGSVPSDGILELIHPLFGAAWPERPLWVCTVRLDDGARVVFGRDPGPVATVGEAVAASCAIPGWFAPVRIGAARYVDGGVHSASNLDTLAGLPLDVVVVSSPMSARPGALLPTPDGAMRAAGHVRLRSEARRLRRQGTTVLALEPDAADLRVMGRVLDAMDRTRRESVVRHVRSAMARRLVDSGAAELLRGAARHGFCSV